MLLLIVIAGLSGTSAPSAVPAQPAVYAAVGNIHMSGPVYGLAINPITHVVYASLPYAEEIAVIDARTFAVIGTIQVDGFPFGIAVNEATNRVYAMLGRRLAVVDGATNSVTCRDKVRRNVSA